MTHYNHITVTVVIIIISSDDESQSSQAYSPYGALRVLQLKNCNVTFRGPMDCRDLIYLQNVRISEKVLHVLLASPSLLENSEISSIDALKRLELEISSICESSA